MKNIFLILNSKILNALIDQASKLGHTTSIYMHAPYYEYVNKLTNKLPGDLKSVYLVNSGSEATELAIQMARLYTGRHDIVSLKNCYHGALTVSRATTACAPYKYPIPPPSGHIHVKFVTPVSLGNSNVVKSLI